MDLLQGVVVATHHTKLTRAHSALPDAPVVPYVEKRPRAPRTRRTLAAVLQRAADAVAPPARTGGEAFAGGRVR
jgi:hypothetical protein